MSGYLEIKLTDKSTRGFTPWKAWKKQWCTLRPSPVKENGVIIVFHGSVRLASNSQVEIPRKSTICRTDSRTKNYSFGIFSSVEGQKPILLLAGQSETESQLWMSRIRSMLLGKSRTDTYISHKTDFNISLIDSNYTNSCGLKGLFGVLKINSEGFQIYDSSKIVCKVSLKWEDISDISLGSADKIVDHNKICVITTNSDYRFGIGRILIFCQNGKVLIKTLRTRNQCHSPEITLRHLNRRLSRSEGTLCSMQSCQLGDSQRDSGLSSCGPGCSDNSSKWSVAMNDSSVRVSMDENGYVLKGKVASTLISAGIYLSTPGYQNSPNTSSENQSDDAFTPSDDFLTPLVNFQDGAQCYSERRCSSVSIASGIYEEISEQIPETKRTPAKYQSRHFDNTYEVLGDCIYGTTRRHTKRFAPPPLPPRCKVNSGRLDSASDSGVEEESLCSTPMQDDLKWSSIHGSLGSLTPPNQSEKLTSNSSKCNFESSSKTALKNGERVQSTLDLFRNRIKSDSHISKCHEEKSSFDGDSLSLQAGDGSMTRRKRFEFNVTPSKSIHLIKNSKMGRALRKLGGSNNFNSVKNVAKSCETLDADEALDDAVMKRCSKSEEQLDASYKMNTFNSDLDKINEINRYNVDFSDCLSHSDDNIQDLSIICTENMIKNTYPPDILDLVLMGKADLASMRLKQKAAEDVYMPMSPCGKLVNIPQAENAKSFLPSSDVILVEDNYMIMKSA